MVGLLGKVCLRERGVWGETSFTAVRPDMVLKSREDRASICAPNQRASTVSNCQANRAYTLSVSTQMSSLSGTHLYHQTMSFHSPSCQQRIITWLATGMGSLQCAKYTVKHITCSMHLIHPTLGDQCCHTHFTKGKTARTHVTSFSP